MAKIIVVTNFSQSSRNALDYTCAFFNKAEVNILLLHIYSFSASLAGDAMAIAAMSETITNDELKLKREIEWVNNSYPNTNINAEMITGVFMDELKEKIAAEEAALVVMGAAGNYNELLSWDVNIINAFIDLATPVLIVPAEKQYRSIEKIAFACNYYRDNLLKPVSMIRRLIEFTKAQLYVIHVVVPTETISETALNNKLALQENIQMLDPIYYEPALDNIVNAVDEFTATEQIDMLIVIPSRHGIWSNIFQQNHTKGLVYLNHTPVLSLHQQPAFI